MSDFVIKNGILKRYTKKAMDVVLPEGITGIGDWVFQDCKNLRSITIPEGVTSIGNMVFEGCKNLQSVTIPEGLQTIGNYAFSGCEKLQTIAFPEGLTTIGYDAFSGCKDLQSITLPESVTTIGSQAFQNCEKLASITIPEGVTAIEERTFSNCKKLESITILGNAVQVYPDALEKCHPKNIVAPGVATEVWKKKGLMFVAGMCYLTHRTQYTNPKINAEYDTYLAYQKRKVLPYFWEKDDLTAIIYYAETGRITPGNFEKDYLLPAQQANAMQCVVWLLDWRNENITPKMQEKQWEREINKDPLNVADMKKLWKYTNWEDGSVHIDGYKGEETEIYIPERIGKRTVTTISDNAFSEYDKLQSITIPEGVQTIGSKAFSGCTNLHRVAIPESVTTICKSAFLGCESLRSITIPAGIEIIGGSTFFACKQLLSITVPEGVTSIGKRAFFECENLRSVTISEGVTGIGQRVFYRCIALQSVTIPASVTAIGEDAFYGCDKLTIHAPKGSYAETYAKENNIPFVAE